MQKEIDEKLKIDKLNNEKEKDKFINEEKIIK